MKLSPAWSSSACCWKKVHGFEILLKEMQIKCSNGVILLRSNRGLFMRFLHRNNDEKNKAAFFQISQFH